MARIIPQTPQRGAARNLLSVVDTYYAPARDRMGEAALQKGFGDVSKLVGGMAQQRRQEEITEVKIQAQQDAMVGDDPDEELTKVRMGGLFRANSRAYNQVYNETLGKQAAIEFQNKAALDYEKSGMKRSTDPNRFREWMNERVDGFLKDEQSQNPYFLAGAMGYVQQTTINMSAAHTSNISAQMERNHLAAIQTQANDIALKVANGEIPIEEMLGHVTGINSQGYSTGLPGPKVRKPLFLPFYLWQTLREIKRLLMCFFPHKMTGLYGSLLKSGLIQLTKAKLFSQTSTDMLHVSNEQLQHKLPPRLLAQKMVLLISSITRITLLQLSNSFFRHLQMTAV